jgi:16S rRNA A1518/A1519 N6-dimethyltransferase RsmA/KsgA/DIM1 with predicted DNA glycosylase/AP lyase activity
MTSGFTVQHAAGYEQLMGRWSQKLALPFIDFAGIADGEKILDVGCGTGSLTFALARAADLNQIVAIDYSPVFVEETARRNSDPRIKVQQADALDAAERARLEAAMRDAYQAGRPDGPRSFANVAWACRGVAP